MGAYRNISNELKAFFNSNSFLKILLPLDIILIAVGLAILLLNFLGIIFTGSFWPSLFWYVFILGLLLAYASFHQLYLYLGFFAYGALLLIEFLYYGIKGYWNWGLIISVLVYGGLGYLVFRQSTKPVAG